MFEDSPSNLGSIFRAVWEKLHVPTSSCPYVMFHDVLAALADQLQSRENPLYSPLERRILAYVRIAGPWGRLALQQALVAETRDIMDENDPDIYEAKLSKFQQSITEAIDRLAKAKVIRVDDLYCYAV